MDPNRQKIIILLLIFSGICILGINSVDLTIRNSAQWNWRPCGEPCHWEWYRAQLVVESGLDPGALSHAGAQGIAQFMPKTWAEVSKRHGVSDRYTPFDHKIAIELGAKYMRELIGQWDSPRPDYDRMALARASYNAGLGNILQAQKLCGGCTSYLEIINMLPGVTGDHAVETINYERKVIEEYQK